MDLLSHIMIFVFAVAVILFAGIFLVIDMFGRVDFITEKAPWLGKALGRRSAVGVLLLANFFLLIGVGYELSVKEVPEVPGAPIVKIIAPPPPIQLTEATPPPVVKVFGVQQKRRAYMAFEEPQVTFEMGKPLSVNIGCSTKSGVPAQRVSCNGQYFVRQLENGTLGQSASDSLFKTFTASMKPNDENSRPTVNQGEAAYGTSFGAALNQEMKLALDGPTYALVVTGVLFYEDDEGSHRMELCRWIQPPLGQQPRVWHFCEGHNGTVR